MTDRNVLESTVVDSQPMASEGELFSVLEPNTRSANNKERETQRANAPPPDDA